MTLLATFPAHTAAAPPPRLEARAWSNALVPSVYLAADSTKLRAGYPPDSLAQAARPTLAAAFSDEEPRLDGHLDDWHLVRWNELGGVRSMVRGSWNGPDDIGLQFALRWRRDGLLLGARLRDDQPQGPEKSRHGRQLESVLLSVASRSPVVQHYWVGGSRTIRVWVDGRTEAWNEFLGRRHELFDAASLGVRAATHRQAGAQGIPGSDEIELFVPWDVLYPALPGDHDPLLCNVFVEDVDAAGADKLAAWCTRVEGNRLRAGWANLSLLGGPPPGTWLVSQGGRHAETQVEWAVAPWGKATATEVELRAHGGVAATWPAFRARVAGPAILRLTGVPEAANAWASDRRFEVALGPRGAAAWRTSELCLVPSDAALGRAVADAEKLRGHPAGSGAFPTVDDVLVRLERARLMTAGLGEWRARRFHVTGVTTLRAAGWQAIERQLAEAGVLRDVLEGGSGAAEAERRFDLRWSARTSRGVPTDVVLLRGYRSVVDQSVQPYALYVPHAATSGPVPLLVALHDIHQNESAMLQETSLANQAEERGWIVVSPFGRGDAGFEHAGERDVLDVLQQVRAQLPVDGRRIYVTGTGMGGTASWLLCLRHPDLFAAASIVSGYGDMSREELFKRLGYQQPERAYYDAHDPARLLRPGLKTAFRIAHALHDRVITVGHARVMDKRLSELQLPHELALVRSGDHGLSFFEQDMPAGVRFLAAHRRDRDGEPSPRPFGGVGGPVADVFPRGPFVVVYGTRGPASRRAPAAPDTTRAPSGRDADRLTAQQFGEEWQSLFAGKARVVSDSAVTPSMLRDANLVLVGDATTNALVARWASELPVHYLGDGFQLLGHTYRYANSGILYVAVNPEFKERSLVVVSGMNLRLGSYTKSLLKLGADWSITEKRVRAVGNYVKSSSVSEPSR